MVRGNKVFASPWEHDHKIAHLRQRWVFCSEYPHVIPVEAGIQCFDYVLDSRRSLSRTRCGAGVTVGWVFCSEYSPVASVV
jgi:hypothetical protein